MGVDELRRLLAEATQAAEAARGQSSTGTRWSPNLTPRMQREAEARGRLAEVLVDHAEALLDVVEAAREMRWTAHSGWDEKSDVLVPQSDWQALRGALARLEES